MGQMDFISNIFERVIFFKTVWEAWSHVTDVYADQSLLFVHSILADGKTVATQLRSVYIHVPLIKLV